MKLDFSVLNNIGRSTESLLKDFKDSQVKIIRTESLNPSESIVGFLRGIVDKPDTPKRYNRIEQDQQERERASQVYTSYQENIKKSEQLRSEISKGLKAGEPPEVLFLKALECISLMTGDRLFLEQNKTKLKQKKERFNSSL